MKSDTIRYALFKDDRQISKAHSSRWAVVTEAFEMGAVISGASDFVSGRMKAGRFHLIDGYDIREVKHVTP